MNRRMLLTTTALIPATALLSGCQGLSSFFGNLPQFATDAETIAAAITKILPDIQAITGLAGGALTTVKNAITSLTTIAAEIGSAAASGASGLVSNFASVYNTILSAIPGGISVPGIVGTVLQAGVALLPQILAAVGVMLATRPATMSPERARAVLVAVAGA
jgi:outer membrane murein-binding lipoprotein Lpp